LTPQLALGPGFNLFDPDDENLLSSIVRGEFNVSGLQNKTLRRHLPEFSSGQVSRSVISFSCRKTSESE